MQICGVVYGLLVHQCACQVISISVSYFLRNPISKSKCSKLGTCSKLSTLPITANNIRMYCVVNFLRRCFTVENRLQ